MAPRNLQDRLAQHITHTPDGHHIWTGPFNIPAPKQIKPSRYINRRTGRVSVTKGIRNPRPIMTFRHRTLSVIRLILKIQDDPHTTAVRTPICKLYNCVNPNHFKVVTRTTTPTLQSDDIADLMLLLDMIYPRPFNTIHELRDHLSAEFTIPEYTEALLRLDLPEWKHLIP